MARQAQDGDYLKRLPPEFYRSQSCVHWSLTIEDRKTGWLVPIFYYKFREILTHAMFRYGLCCPIFCLMPDHMHFLWLGILDQSDQRVAMKFFRRQLSPVLEKLQDQPYDHVLREDERQPAHCKPSWNTSHGTRNEKNSSRPIRFVNTTSPVV